MSPKCLNQYLTHSWYIHFQVLKNDFSESSVCETYNETESSPYSFLIKHFT